jgi:hypothetical protein
MRVQDDRFDTFSEGLGNPTHRLEGYRFRTIPQIVSAISRFFVGHEIRHIRCPRQRRHHSLPEGHHEFRNQLFLTLFALQFQQWPFIYKMYDQD